MARYIVGREATVTWDTTGPVGTAPETNIITTNFNRVAFRITRKHYLTVPPGYQAERYTSGIIGVRGVLGNWYDISDSLPTVPGGNGAPDGDSGFLTILLASGHSWKFPAIFTTLDWSLSMDDGGPPQVYQLGFALSMQSNVAPFTVTG